MTINIHQLKSPDKARCLDIIKKVVIAGFIEERIDINTEKEKIHLNEELACQKERILTHPQNYFIAKNNNQIIGLIAPDFCKLVRHANII